MGLRQGVHLSTPQLGSSIGNLLAFCEAADAAVFEITEQRRALLATQEQAVQRLALQSTSMLLQSDVVEKVYDVRVCRRLHLSVAQRCSGMAEREYLPRARHATTSHSDH